MVYIIIGIREITGNHGVSQLDILEVSISIEMVRTKKQISSCLIALL